MEPTPNPNISLDNRIEAAIVKGWETKDLEGTGLDEPADMNRSITAIKALINQEKIKELENLNEFAQYNNDGYKQLPPDYIDRRIDQLKEGSN